MRARLLIWPFIALNAFAQLFGPAFIGRAYAMPLRQRFEQIYPNGTFIPTTTGSATISWPSSSPVIHPGVMCINAICYNFTAENEGLITFTAFDPHMTMYPGIVYQPYHSNGNLILVNPASPDIYTFIGAYDRLVGYGSADSGLSVTQRKVQMRKRIVWLQCQDTSDLLISMLADIGVQARRVHLLSRATTATQTGLDDGHVAVEVKMDGKWCLFDPSFDGYYTNGKTHLSAIGLHDVGMPHAIYVRQAPTEVTGGDIYTNTLISTGPPAKYATHFRIRSWFDQKLSTPAKRKAWRDRTFGVYGWAHPENGEIWWLDDGLTMDQKRWIASLSPAYKVKTRRQIKAQFYP